MSLRLRLLLAVGADRHRRAGRGRLRHLLGAAHLPVQPGRPDSSPRTNPASTPTSDTATGVSSQTGSRPAPNSGLRDGSAGSDRAAASRRELAQLHGRRGPSGFANIFGISYASVVNQKRAVVDGLECPPTSARPPTVRQLPAPITGFTTQPDGSQVGLLHHRVHRCRRARRSGSRAEKTSPAEVTS